MDLEQEIEHGNKLLTGLENVTPECSRPRNTLVTARCVGKLDEGQIGSIIMPTESGVFQIYEVVQVGPGHPGNEQHGADTSDLRPGQRVLVKAETHHPGTPHRRKDTLKFTVGGELLEILDQSAILVILDTPEDTHEAGA